MAMPDDDGWIRDLASSLDALSDPRGEADRSGEAPDWPPAVQAEIDAFRFLVAHGAPRPR